MALEKTVAKSSHSPNNEQKDYLTIRAKQRHLLELRLELSLFLKSKSGLTFTLRDLFKEVNMLDLDNILAKIILQNVTLGQRFSMIPDVTNNSNIDDEYYVTFNTSLEYSFFLYLDSILKFECSFEGSKMLKPYRTTMKRILIQEVHEKKVRSFLAFTLRHPTKYNNSISNSESDSSLREALDENRRKKMLKC